MKVSVLVLLVIAFASQNVQAAQQYSIGFLNKTGHDLDRVELYYGDNKAAGPCGLVKGGQKKEGYITSPIPAEAEVRWVDDEQHPHAVKIKLEGTMPNGFDGTVFVVINNDSTVQTKLIASDDSAAIIELRKGLRPEDEYLLGFVNKTGHDLDDVAVYYNGKRAGSGKNLLARVRVVYSDRLALPIPSEVEVRWNEEGKAHSVKAKFDGVVPDGYARGTIYFVIRTNDVIEVKPVKWGDHQKASSLVK